MVRMGERSVAERMRRAWTHYRLAGGRALRRPLIESALRRANFQLSDSLILSGMARGGTTWLFEILSELPGIVPNWEPLNGPNAGNLANGNLTDLLTLRERGGWQTDYIRLRHLREPRRVLTKFVRAASLLPALLDAHAFRYKPIVLLRHPIATADSYVRAWGRLEKHKQWQPEPARAYNPLFFEYETELQSYETELEFRTAVWCLHHRWLLDRPELLNRVQVVRYEELVLDPVATLRPLLTEWSPELNQTTFLEQFDFRRASSSDFDGSLLADPERQVDKWRSSTDPVLLERCLRIMERFGWGEYM